MHGPILFHPPARRGRVLLGAALLSVGLGGCRAALSLDDYEFAEPGGSGGEQVEPPLLPAAGRDNSAGGSSSETQPGSSAGSSSGGSSSDAADAGCTTACELPHADAACADTGCVIVQCIAPWRDANGSADDGCEAGDVPSDGLTLWFMADQGAVVQPDGSVSTWIDQSGSGYAATQPVSGRRPTWQEQADGPPLLSFDGVDDYFDLPTGFATFDGSSFFAVVEAEPNDKCAGILHFSNGPDANDVEFGRHRTNLLLYEVNGDWIDGTTDAFVVGRRLVVSSVQAAGSGAVELRIDGTRDQGKTVELPDNVVRRTNYVGRNAYTEQPDLCSMYFHGRIGELLFYPRGVSNGERARIEAYLHEKWQPE